MNLHICEELRIDIVITPADVEQLLRTLETLFQLALSLSLRRRFGIGTRWLT